VGYLPSLRSDTLGPVVVAVDTSGSIDDVTLAAFAAEITAVLDEAAPAAIHVVYCDDAIAGSETYEPGDVINLTPRGGGGTAFRPVFDWIAGSDIQPACAVYLTDLDGRDFGPEPGYKVLRRVSPPCGFRTGCAGSTSSATPIRPASTRMTC
jgi:predicted metal-dependent peptidase